MPSLRRLNDDSRSSISVDRAALKKSMSSCALDMSLSADIMLFLSSSMLSISLVSVLDKLSIAETTSLDTNELRLPTNELTSNVIEQSTLSFDSTMLKIPLDTSFMMSISELVELDMLSYKSDMLQRTSDRSTISFPLFIVTPPSSYALFMKLSPSIVAFVK